MISGMLCSVNYYPAHIVSPILNKWTGSLIKYFSSEETNISCEKMLFRLSFYNTIETWFSHMYI